MTAEHGALFDCRLPGIRTKQSVQKPVCAKYFVVENETLVRNPSLLKIVCNFFQGLLWSDGLGGILERRPPYLPAHWSLQGRLWLRLKVLLLLLPTGGGGSCLLRQQDAGVKTKLTACFGKNHRHFMPFFRRWTCTSTLPPPPWRPGPSTDWRARSDS